MTLGTNTLEPGNSTGGTITHLVNASDGSRVTNNVTVTGTDPLNETVTDTDSCTINTGIAAGIEIEKTASITGSCPGTNPLLVHIGDTVTYCFNVTNTGDVTVTNITVTDDKYGPVAVLNTTLGPGETTFGTTTYIVTESDIPQVINNVTITGIDPRGDTVSDTESCTVNIELQLGIDVNKTADPTAARAGTDVTFTLNVTNTGDCTLNPVRVEDTLPAGMSYVASKPEANETVGTLTWNDVTNGTGLAPGASTSITLVAHIDSGASGTLTDTVNVKGTSSSGENATDSATADVQVLSNGGSNPDIKVNMTASHIEGAPCTNVTFTINVTNTGDCTLNPVMVVDTLPTGMSYVASSPAADADNGTVTWNDVTNGTGLAPGAGTTLSLVAHIDTGASGTLTDIVNVTGTPPAGENATDSATADVQALTPDIKVNMTASHIEGAPCTNVTFTINVTNTGDCTLNPVMVVDTLPTGMSYVASSPAADADNGTVTWNDVTNGTGLAPGAGTTLSLVAHIDTGASGTLTDIVNVTGTPPAGENATDSATADVQALTPDIRVNNTVSPAAAMPDTDVTFTINVTNTGDCTLNPVRIVDTLPAEMSYVASKPEADYQEGQMIIWNNVSLLDPGESAIITLVAHIESGASGRLTDIANASGTPPAGDNVTDSDTANVEVGGQPPTPTPTPTPPIPAQVPEFTSVGLIALIGLLSVIAALRIKRRE